jgi:hypothetical protein
MSEKQPKQDTYEHRDGHMVTVKEAKRQSAQKKRQLRRDGWRKILWGRNNENLHSK